ncbi:MAG: hypothetical protein JSR99_15250 [Proteobacteria bacterium]|nr:hypothetical protein [Pseudomonadota bacterium]
MDNIDRVFTVLRLARDAIYAAYGSFHAQAVHAKEWPDMNGILEAATKEVFTFAFASASLVGAYRRLKSAAPETAMPLGALSDEIFSDQLLNHFIKELRNNFGHSRLFEAQPQYTITWADDRRVTTNLRFDRTALLEGEWNLHARQFIETASSLDVMEIISDYYGRADRLHRRYLSTTGLEHDEYFKDYLRIREARSTIATQMTLGLFLQNAVKNGVNPYVHLCTYFSDDEIRRSRCYPDHSMAQVDFLIASRDPLGLCSDELRANLYALFGVTAASTNDTEIR